MIRRFIIALVISIVMIGCGDVGLEDIIIPTPQYKIYHGEKYEKMFDRLSKEYLFDSVDKAWKNKHIYHYFYLYPDESEVCSGRFAKQYGILTFFTTEELLNDFIDSIPGTKDYTHHTNHNKWIVSKHRLWILKSGNYYVPGDIYLNSFYMKKHECDEL